MKTLLTFLLLLLTTSALFSQTVLVASIDGTINPAASAYVQRVVEQAREMNAECLVIRLNTPGGLLKSTRVIVSELLESHIPVVIYVSPGGAQAASAGVFITLAGHVAAMAPGTNIGAAAPVALQGGMDSTMAEKATNDAAAFIKTIAEKRKRNLAWAEQAVRKSISITETEALDENVIDLIAHDLDDLMEQIDGRVVEIGEETAVLETAEAQILSAEMDWSEEILDILSDPNIAYIFLMLGIYGLLFELYNPGSILPGVVGVISLILAFYSLHTLPVNYAGLALIIFAVVLFIAEIKITSYGMLTIGGIISLILGSLMLIRTDSALEFFEVSWGVILTFVILTVLFFLVVIAFGIKAQRRKPTTGQEGIVGETGVAMSALNPEGKVQVHGEIWNAVSVSETIKAKEKIKVVGVDGLTLRVERFR